jgi:asparagine synthase (glutamine-hydrolysing)
MPGFGGMVSSAPPERRKEILRTMLGTLTHERHHESGTYRSAALGVELGWIVDSARGAARSVLHEQGHVSLVLSGDVLSVAGAARLLATYGEREHELVAGLNGWFAGVLVDHRQGRCFLFNDRYGMKRVFVHERDDGVYFASEAKALLAAFPETRSFDRHGLAEYLTSGCTLGSRSLFTGIAVLPGASLWMMSQGRVHAKAVYFNRREWEEQPSLDRQQFAEELQHVFPIVARKHADGSAPVGISLTGGLDSRMLMAGLHMAPAEFPCYTFGSMYRDTFDVTVARAVAERCQQTHRTLVLGAEFLKDFPRYMEQAVLCSDGYIGMSGAAELYLNRLARNIAPIRLTGNYGSELLRGARAFKSALPESSLVTSGFRSALDEAHDDFIKASQSHSVSFTLFHQAPNQGYGRAAVEGSQVLVRAPFMDNELAKLAYRAPRSYDAGTDVSAALIARHQPQLFGIMTDRGQFGGGIGLTRMLQRLYCELLFKGEYWASHGMPQFVAAGVHRFPSLSPDRYLLGRHKFQHFPRWLRGELSAYIREVLPGEASELGPYIDLQRFESMVDAHLVGRRNHFFEIDTVLTLGLVSKRLFRATEGSGSRQVTAAETLQ